MSIGFRALGGAMEIGISVDLARDEDELRNALSSVEAAHQDVIHVRSVSHRAADVCSVLRCQGLYRFDRAEDTPRGCRVSARALKPKQPPPPQFSGPVGVTR